MLIRALVLSAFFLFTATSFANTAGDDIIFGAEDGPTIRMNEGQVSARYRIQTKDDGSVSHKALQQLTIFDVTIGFFKNKVRIDFQGSTGSAFDSSWGNTGVGGTHDADMAFYLRRLSMTLSPVSGLELTVGSMAPKYGAGSENSYFDADGYIMGYRARVAFDKGDLVVTGGYVGDFKDPNLFSRLGRIAEFNYLQMVLTRSIGEIVRASLDYSYLDGGHYARAAVQFDVARWTKFIDSIAVEDMINVSTIGKDTANVVAVKLSKRFKDVFAGRDITTALTYSYRTDSLDIPIGDKIFDGQAVRINIMVPNLIETKGGKLGLYADYVQSVTTFDRMRAELGIVFKF